jgi:hypothetical protein
LLGGLSEPVCHSFACAVQSHPRGERADPKSASGLSERQVIDGDELEHRSLPLRQVRHRVIEPSALRPGVESLIDPRSVIQVEQPTAEESIRRVPLAAPATPLGRHDNSRHPE